MEATPTERTERENQLDQSKRRPDTCSTCKTKAIIKAFSTRLCETHHKLAMDGSLEKRWGKGERGEGVEGKELMQTKLPEKKIILTKRDQKKNIFAEGELTFKV